MNALADFPQILWSALWTSTLVMLLICCLRGVVRQLFGPHVAYFSWSAVPVVLLAILVPARTQTLSSQQILQPLSGSSKPHLLAINLQEGTSTTMWVALFCLWLGGLLVSVYLMAMRQRHFTLAMGRLRKTSTPGIYEAENDPGLPAAIGLLKPHIVMPPNAMQLFTPEEYRLLLEHERTHLAMKDHWVNAISVSIQCVFWFNPVTHFASSRMRRDQELSCDAHVRARFPKLNRHYGELILKTQLATLRAPMACQWSALHPLKERIMQLKSKSPSLFSRRLGMSLVFAALVGFGYMAWAAQPAKIKLVNPVQGSKSEVSQGPTQHMEGQTLPIDNAVMTPSATSLHREAAKRATIESAQMRAANDAQRVAKEQAELAQAAAERARIEAHAHSRADQERMAADQERMHADSIRRAEVEAETQARATQARADSDRARMDAENRTRAAFDEATQAEAARARAEAESRAASDTAAAAKAASARQAQAQLDAKYDMLRRSRTLTKQLRGPIAVQAAERNVKSP